MPTKYNLATIDHERFQMTRFFLSTTWPDYVTIVEVGKYVRLKIDKKESMRKKPGRLRARFTLLQIKLLRRIPRYLKVWTCSIGTPLI